MVEVLDLSIVIISFILISGLFLTEFYNDNSFDNVNINYSYTDSFDTSNSGFFSSMFENLGNIINGISDIPYAKNLAIAFSGALATILVLVYLRKG